MPQNMDVRILGDAEALALLTRLTTEFANRPAGSGLSTEDLHKITEIEQRLQLAAQRQLDRIERGLEPERMTLTPELEKALRDSLKSMD